MRKHFSNKIWGVLVGTVLLITLAVGTVHPDYASAYNNRPAKNVIFLIGDGMGFSHLTAARLYRGGKLVMDGFRFTGNITTYSANSLVTDSAAAGTALATGFKTDNGMISMTPDGKAVKTLLEAAQEKGKSTGLVTTTRITHATPAVFAAHNKDRDNENEIAVDMLVHEVNVLLGGGKRHWVPKGTPGSKRGDSRDLLKEAARKGYTIVDNRREMLNVPVKDKLLGLFAESHMSYEIDRNPAEEPSLAEMTQKAIDVLSKDKDGFFLMVEGGRIDHASHANDAAAAIKDTLAFDEAVKVALDYAFKNPDTLVVVTADHETGGMSVGAYGEYAVNMDMVRKVKGSLDSIARALESGQDIGSAAKQYLGIELTAEEKAAIEAAENPAAALNELFNKKVLIGWTSHAHTGANVPLMAFGAQASLFTGTLDNTEVASLIAHAMKVELQ